MDMCVYTNTKFLVSLCDDKVGSLTANSLELYQLLDLVWHAAVIMFHKVA